MAKKLVALTFQDIVLQADAETIRKAYEARLKIDELLVKREEAYRQIAEIEQRVEELVGEEGAFVFPEPPVPVAGFNKPSPATRPATAKPKPGKQDDPGTDAEEVAEETDVESEEA